MTALNLHKPNRSEAIYGFLGGLIVAIIASVITLVPWMWPNPDQDDRLRLSIESGFDQLRNEASPERRLGYLDQIDSDLERSWAYLRGDLSRKWRTESESELELRQQAEVARQEAITREQARLEEIRIAERAATEAEEKERLEQERAIVLAEEQARLDEEARQLEEQMIRDAALEQDRRDEQSRLEAVRRANALEAERQWQLERFCRNDNCTSWILR